MERRSPACNECGYCEAFPPGAATSAAVSELKAAEFGEIAEAVLSRVKQRLSGVRSRLVPAAVSARHVHLSPDVLEQLYGRGYELERHRPLSQPRQFAARETVTLVGTRMHSVEGVRILGPLRDYTQVELARTDGVVLGIELPVRDSGRLEGSAPIVLAGPKGAVSLAQGAIRAARHIHASENEAQELGICDGQCVSIRVHGEKAVVFENVLVRVRSDYKLEMHVDTDDANAADIHCDMFVEIVET
ncbi:MAG: phosphate propanoyltransferase [Candidatus Eisenbacteria bacterium]